MYGLYVLKISRKYTTLGNCYKMEIFFFFKILQRIKLFKETDTLDNKTKIFIVKKIVKKLTQIKFTCKLELPDHRLRGVLERDLLCFFCFL